MEIKFQTPLDAESKKQISRALQRLVPDCDSVQVLGYLSGGWGNRNYKIKMSEELFVIRISEEGQQDAETEIRYMQIKNAPELIAYDREEKHLLTRWIEGYVPESKPLSPSQAAIFLKELHAAIPTGITSYDAQKKILRMYESGNASPEDMQPFIDLDWHPRSLQGCHNDLNPWNLLVTSPGVRTLDWESAGDNDPLFDLVGLTYGFRYDDLQTLQCATEYLDSTPDRHFLVDTRIAYVCREHAWAIEQVAIGNPRPEVVQQIHESHAEIQRLHGLRDDL